MIVAPLPENEGERMEALKSYAVLDTPKEEDYDEIVKLASDICQVPISLISLIDMNRQWFKANVGLDADETPRDVAFCTHAILTEDILIVEDALQDNRFFDNPLVTGHPDIRFYAGMPLTSSDGYKLGTLCVIDQKPRGLDELQIQALKVLSRQVMNHLDKRLKVNQLNESLLKINIQHAQLEELYSSNNRMLTIIGHDLRGPLSTLKSMLEMLGDGYISEEDFKSMTEKLAVSLKYSDELIENLMAWARKQFDKQVVEPRNVDIHQKVDASFDLLSFAATKKGTKLVNEIAPGTQIKTDENMLHFMLRNIISNANKFTENGSIRVGIAEVGDEWHITIADTGLGMPPEKLSRLFNWDGKMSTYGTSGEKGSGLGLSMSQEFARKLGGRIEVASEMGNGSVFTIILPIKD